MIPPSVFKHYQLGADGIGSELFIAIMVLVIAFTVLCGVGATAAASRKRSTTRKMIFNNLDFAHCNGYFDPGEHCHDMTARELAHDLVLYSSECEHLTAEHILPYVVDWKRERGLS